MSTPSRTTIRVAVAVVCAASWVLAGAAAVGARASVPTWSSAGPPAGVVPARAAAGSHAATSPNLVYHGGPVMTSGASVKAIFWGSNWANSSFVGDKITGMDAFYSGVGGSSYQGTNTEYTSGAGNVSSAVSYLGHVIDTSSAPSRAPKTSQILAEVARMIPNPVTNGYYPVYVDAKRGHAGYCAWHSTGTANGVVVQFAFFFNLDGDAGCDLHSQGTAALGNVSGHELSETVTDQHLNAWYDSSGAENADKCAWTFGSNLLKLGGSSWKIQGNWSNNAYDANTGYVSGGSVVRGCIDGTN
jgi:hypothetical protein